MTSVDCNRSRVLLYSYKERKKIEVCSTISYIYFICMLNICFEESYAPANLLCMGHADDRFFFFLPVRVWDLVFRHQNPCLSHAYGACLFVNRRLSWCPMWTTLILQTKQKDNGQTHRLVYTCQETIVIHYIFHWTIPVLNNRYHSHEHLGQAYHDMSERQNRAHLSTSSVFFWENKTFVKPLKKNKRDMLGWSNKKTCNARS